MSSVLDQYLDAAGRPSLAQGDPFVEWLHRRMQSLFPSRSIPDLRVVDSDHQATGLITVGDMTCLVWDTRYQTFLLFLIICFATQPTVKCYRETEYYVVRSLEMSLRARGRHEEADALKYEYVPQDWSNSLDVLGDAMRDYVSARLDNESDQQWLRSWSTDEIDAFLEAKVHFPASEVIAFSQMVHRSMMFFMFAHELGHWAFAQHPNVFGDVRKEISKVLMNPDIDERFYETVLPSGYSVSADAQGKWGYDSDTQTMLGFAAWKAYSERVFDDEAVFEEVYCDYFAIEAFARAMVPRFGNKLQFAEYEQAIWMGQHYIKWMSYIRYSLFSHIGVADDPYESLKEKHIRGLMKLAIMNSVVKKRAGARKRKRIGQHRQAIRWFDMLFEMKQNRVFHRLAMHPEVLTRHIDPPAAKTD